jgi:type IV pilus assembly protein PilA
MTRITEALAARMDRIRKGDKGFTLIELLVVVIIIGILAAIAIPVYIGIQNNAKESAVQSDLGNAKTAVVTYYNNNSNAYPTAGAIGTTLQDSGYTQSAATNYDSTALPTLQVITGNKGFCIFAKAVTGTSYAASDTTGVAKGTCTAGKFVAGS